MSDIFYSEFFPENTGSKGSAAFTSLTTNTATIFLYRRSSTALTISDVPNGDVVYTFSTLAINLTAVTNGWTSIVPAGDAPLYVVTAFVGTVEDTVTIETNEWAAPQLLSRSGLSTASVPLYQRNNTGVAPTGITGNTTYTFSTGTLTGSLGSWTPTIPASSSGRFLFITVATAINESNTVTILPAGWSSVRLFSVEGESPVVINLTNDSVTVPANSDGTSPVLTTASTIFSIFEGGADVTASWNVTATPSTGVTGTLSGNTYTVSGFTVDTGTVTFTATRSAYPNQSAVFSLAKARAGTNGTSPIVYAVRSNQGVIKRNSAGTYTSGTIVFSAVSTTGSAAPVAYAGRFIIATSTNGVDYTNTYTSSANESTTTYTLPSSINFVRVRLHLAGGTTTIVDEEIIPVADDGATGAAGAAGAAGAPAVSGYLTNESTSLFAYANGVVVSYGPATGSFVILSGTTDISTNFTLSTISNPQSLTVTYSGRVYTISGGLDPNEDTAALIIRATGSGAWAGAVIDKVFSLAKTRGGYEIVTALPSAGGDPRRFEGSLVFLTTDDKLYRFDGTNWVASIPATDITGQLIGTQITDSAITSPKIASNAIIADKIEAGAVTAAKIAVTQLSAITANVGDLTAGTIRNTTNTYSINLNSGRQIVVSGAFMKVSGVPFGDGPGTSQFIEWYGPIKTTSGIVDPSLCTAVDAIYYLTNVGGAYFGGTLASGIIRNSAQTTSTVSAAFINVGPFSTNGGTKTISLSYAFGSSGGSDPGTVSFSGTTSITVVLEKSTNGGSTWSTIATLTPSETLRSVETYDTGAGSEGDPLFADRWEYGVAGSLTATDNTAAGTMLLRGRITARTLATVSSTSTVNFVNILDNAVQNITVVSTEG